MSDGPHRSLNMRLGWKKVAEFADNDACTSGDISNAVIPALSEDWHSDVSDAVSQSICEVLGSTQASLFHDQKVLQLEALRRMTAGHGLGQVLIDCAVKLADEDKFGPDTPVETVMNALRIWGARHARQIEEHYHRKTNLPRAQNVRTRTEGGLFGVSDKGLARKLLKLDQDIAPRKAPKQTGLDDGVTF